MYTDKVEEEYICQHLRRITQTEAIYEPFSFTIMLNVKGKKKTNIYI